MSAPVPEPPALEDSVPDSHRHLSHPTSWQGQVDFPEYLRRLAESVDILEAMISEQVFCGYCANHAVDEMALAFKQVAADLDSRQVEHATHVGWNLECAHAYISFHASNIPDPSMMKQYQEHHVNNLWVIHSRALGRAEYDPSLLGRLTERLANTSSFIYHRPFALEVIENSIDKIERWLRSPEKDVVLFRIRKRKALLEDNLEALKALRGEPERIVSSARSLSELPDGFDWEAEEQRTISNIPKFTMIACRFKPSLFDDDLASRQLAGCVEFFEERGYHMDALRARRKHVEAMCLVNGYRQEVMDGISRIASDAEGEHVSIEAYKSLALADALYRLSKSGPSERQERIRQIFSNEYYYAAS